ncbi:alpha/beta hydrolase [Rhodococcus aerolatus]
MGLLGLPLPGLPLPGDLRLAAGNAWDAVVRGQLADLRPTPGVVVDETPQRTITRFTVDPDARTGLPVLLVPPLAAPATAFDLRRGCSLVEHLVARGREVYLVDYGPVAFADRGLGIEHWVDDLLPGAVQVVARNSAEGGGADGGVHLLGWSLGGIFALFTAAAHPGLPLRSVTAVASPLDISAVPLLAPFRPIARYGGNRAVGVLYRSMGSIPAPLTRWAFQLSSLEKYLTKPLALLANLDDREFLEQVEAVDHFMAGMYAYPGRTFGQLYHAVFRTDDLAGGTLDLGGRRVSLASVGLDVHVVGGSAESLAPLRSVHRAVDLLTGARSVEVTTAPGGHLGVLTGREARTTTWPAVDRFLAAHDGPAPG